MPLHAVSKTEYAAILLPMMAVGKIRLDDVRAVVTRHDAPASEGDTAQARRMVALMVDGLRFGAGAPAAD